MPQDDVFTLPILPRVQNHKGFQFTMIENREKLLEAENGTFSLDMSQTSSQLELLPHGCIPPPTSQVELYINFSSNSYV